MCLYRIVGSRLLHKKYKNLALWVLVACFAFIFFQALYTTHEEVNRVPYSDFLKNVEDGRVAKVIIRGLKIDGIEQNGRTFSSYDPRDPELVSKLLAKNVVVAAGPFEERSTLFSWFLSWLPLLILGLIWFFFIHQMQSGGGRAFGFGKSKAKLLNSKLGKVTFADVAGIDEAKNELEEIVDFLKDPNKFRKLGGKIPRGVLLIGPPGTGKTLLARAIAGEANVPFFNISGSEFVEMFVGVGASRVRDMFEQGKKNAPCIIFIDEIDAVGRHRGVAFGGGNDEREQTLNQLLVEMDGFEENNGVIVISATNRPDVLDPALLRPGRFDRQVIVPSPDLKGREQILLVHLKKVPLAEDVDAKVLARGTPGFSGADLANLVNEAALLAARRGKRVVCMEELEESKDKVMMGAERRSMVMTDEARKLTAYHEAGHAIVALHIPESDPIHKATIIPRGQALGMVMRLPENDRVSVSRVKLEADLAVAAGGRIAEEMIFGHDKVTTGASADIEQATNIARHMIIEWGMSDKLGFLSYSDDSGQNVFLGGSSGGVKRVSAETAKIIDSEIRAITDRTYARAKKILEDNKDKLELLAQGLLEHETLSGDEIKNIINGVKIEKKQNLLRRTTKKSQMPNAENVEKLEESTEKIPAVAKPKTRSRKSKETKV